MLSGCRQAIVFVEGTNDMLFLSMLAPENYVVKDVDRHVINQAVWECEIEDRECLVMTSLEGIGNVEKTIERIVKWFKVLGPNICVILLVDSDEKDPIDRLQRYVEQLRLPGKVRRYHDRFFAYHCLIDAKDEVKLCMASWRCCAECWIALLLPENPVTSLDSCDSNLRKLCHDVVREANVDARMLKSLWENVGEPWKGIFSRLASQIRDAELS